MNARKIETRQNRLNQVQAIIEARRKVLTAKGLDAKLIEKDSTMRHLLAEARKVRRSIESIKREPPKAEKPAKEAAQPKAPKPPKQKKPKEKKPKQEEEAPPG